jgi:hypothetical protein
LTREKIRERNPSRQRNNALSKRVTEAETVRSNIPYSTEHILDLQRKVGNRTVSRLIGSGRIRRGAKPRHAPVGGVVQRQGEYVQRSIEPWKDEPSNYWAIRPLAGGEIAIGLGRLHLEFELKNRTSGQVYDAVFSGQVAGVAAGFSLNMDPSWINFGSAQKVRPSELSGLGANIRSLAIGIGIIGLSTASLKLPNVDTAPARIDIGGLSASFGIRASAFYAGGEFRVYKQEGLPEA